MGPAHTDGLRLFTRFISSDGKAWPAFAGVLCETCSEGVKATCVLTERNLLESVALSVLSGLCGPLSRVHHGFVADLDFDPEEVMRTGRLPMSLVSLSHAAEVEAACGVDECVEGQQ